jgi:hypothetical protein
MSDVDARLDRLGEALRGSAREDLAAAERGARERRSGRRRRVQVAIALCALVLAVPAIALATGAIGSDQEVAEGLPHGYAMLAGTDPVCAALRERVEYDCVLANPPEEIGPPEGMERAIGEFIGAPGEWKGVVVGTVDESRHVDGGCRSQNADGTSWRCYLGKAALTHKILGPRALGQYLAQPAER